MVKEHEEYIVDGKGRKRAVVLSMKEYQRLQEDLHDLTVVAERREEATTSFDEVKRRLVADGLLRD